MSQSQFSQMTDQTMSMSLAVNTQYVDMLSPLTVAQMSALVEEAWYARQMGDGQSFLIAFDETSSYEGENFNWFKARYERFVYVDRIVVGQPLQRQGIARAFYQELSRLAQNHRATHLCAEVNIEPPNPASHGFHQKFGFDPVGDAHVGGKHVQYYVKTL